jgi:hypothetical protein
MLLKSSGTVWTLYIYIRTAGQGVLKCVKCIKINFPWNGIVADAMGLANHCRSISGSITSLENVLQHIRYRANAIRQTGQEPT